MIVWGRFAYGIALHAGKLDVWATDYFGTLASTKAGYQDSFIRWLLYFSPYMCIGEFILGCMTAQVYMSLISVEVDRIERALAPIIVVLATVSVPIILYFMYVPKGTNWIRNLNNNFGLAPSLAVLLFCGARYRFGGIRILSAPWLVKLGDTSYSIYRIHMLVFSTVINSTSGQLASGPVGNTLSIFRIVAMLAIVLFISNAFYVNVEDPARRILRRLWHQPRLLARPMIIAFTPLVVAAFFFGTDRFLATREAARLVATRGIIVHAATYGENCGAAHGNATHKVQLNCNGKAVCSYIVDVAALGDVAPRCGKDFSVEYICAPDKTPRTTKIPGEAGFKSMAIMRCKAN